MENFPYGTTELDQTGSTASTLCSSGGSKI
jgi:hypothetical protein